LSELPEDEDEGCGSVSVGFAATLFVVGVWVGADGEFMTAPFGTLTVGCAEVEAKDEDGSEEEMEDSERD
jgi:hypothetical protein